MPLPRQGPSISAFLAPPGSERHYNPHETIADSIRHESNSKEREAATTGLTVPQRLMKEAIETKNAQQVWHTYTRLASRVADPQIPPFPASTYFKMLRSFQATKTKQSGKRAQIIYNDMKTFHRPKITMLNRMLDILVRHEDVNWAIDYFQRDASRFHLTPTVWSYNIMIRALASSGHVREAEKIYEDMRTGVIPQRPDVSTYSTLMSHYSRIGMQDAADKILEDMLKDNVKPNMWIFNSAIQRFVKKKDYVGAQRVMALLKESDLKPDVITYSTLIDGYAKDGDEEAIANIQAEMALNHVYANAKTVTSAIKVFAKAFLDQNIDASLEGLLRSMPSEEMNDLTFGVLMNVYGKRKDLDAAMGVYQHILSKGREVNEVILCSLLDGHVRAGEILAANRIFHEHFTARNIRPVSAWGYSIMIAGCCKQNNLQDALHYYHEMINYEIAPDATICSRLIQLYLEHHQLDNAQHMLQLMKNSKLSISVHTYTMLMDHLSAFNNFRGALRYYQEMLDSGIEPDVHCYTVLINTHIRAKNFAACDRTFEQMEQAGIRPTTEAFTSMVHAHSLQGSIERVKKYWTAMTDMGLMPDLKSFTLLMQTYSQSGNVEMVEFIYRDICRKGFKLDAILLTTLTGTYSDMPRLNVARIDEIWTTMEELELEPTPEYFKLLLDAYGSHGMPDRVVKTWSQLQKNRGKPLDWTLTTSNLLHLIEACRDRGYMDTLHSVWHTAVYCASPAHNGKTAFDVDRGHLTPSEASSLVVLPPSHSTTPINISKPAPAVFTAYLNALLTHNQFSKIEELLQKQCQKMRLTPRTKDFEMLFTGLAQYDFLKQELARIREVVVKQWPKVVPMVDKIIQSTRRI
ncbi:hypothetical protein EDD11_000720 [Mortierella claussenii]|nr:hypothetical protein EDD11_000720 [Mortierella claussenii]